MVFSRRFFSVLITSLMLLIGTGQGYTQVILALKADILAPTSKTTELYIRLDAKPQKHNIFFLQNPHRLVMDVMQMRWKAHALNPDGVIKKIRYGKRPDGSGRIVLDLKNKSHLHDFTIAPHPREKGKWLLKLILNHSTVTVASSLQQQQKKTTKYVSETSEASPPQKNNTQKNVEKPLAFKPQKQKVKSNFQFTSRHKLRKITKRPNDILVVIDPGHGGNDPGAISRNKRREKDIVLRFSKELYRKLNATKGIRAVLTRDQDFYIPLAERVALAQYYQADLFMSIHADALHKHNVKGATIYTLSDTASDAVSEALAKSENRSDIIAGVKVPAQEEEVTDILLDLLRRETDGHSYEFAEQLVRYMGRSTSMMRKPHRKAGFAVLKAPDIPSVLIELGYLTNDEDERNMMNRGWRRKMIFEMTTAIKKWHVHRRQGVI